MDPLLLVAQLWWVVPAAGGGAAAAYGIVRYGRRERARTLEYAAARHELEAARQRIRAARGGVKSAQAAHLVAKSARLSGQGSTAAVERARRDVVTAQRELRAAQTALRGRRMQVQGARAELRGMPRGAEHLPLARLLARHDHAVSQWMEYETDPAKTLAFPAMSDTSVPTTAALLDAMNRARWLRPASLEARMTPEAFARYRASVADLESALAAAEAEAWRRAGASARAASGARPPRPQEEGARFAVPPQVREAWDLWVVEARAGLTTAASAAVEAAMDAMSRRQPPRGDDHRD